MRSGVVIGAAALAAVAAGCARSPDELVAEGSKKPGVVSVEVTDNGGENDIPFSGPLPNVVRVTMRADATAEQVRAVVEEYADDRADGEVEHLEIRLHDKDRLVVLGLGQMVTKTDPWVAGLVAVAGEPDVEQASLDPWADEPEYADEAAEAGEASLRLRTVPYRRVRQLAVEYDRLLPPITTSVRSDGTLLMLDGGERSTARLAAADAVERRFGLRAAVVSRQGALRLTVPVGTDVAHVRRFVASRFGSRVGRVIVTDVEPVDLSGARGDDLRRMRTLVNDLRFYPGFRSARYRNGHLEIGIDHPVRIEEIEVLLDGDIDRPYQGPPVRYVLPSGKVVEGTSQTPG